MRTCLDFIEKNEEWLTASRMERNHDEDRRLKRWNEEEAARVNISNKAETTTPSVQTTLQIEDFWKNWRPPAKTDSRGMENSRGMGNSKRMESTRGMEKRKATSLEEIDDSKCT